jgi:hypothetical protein
MRARVAVVVVGGSGKDAIIATAINRCHHQQCCHWRCWLNPTALPPLMTTIATVDNRHCCFHAVNEVDRQKPAVVVCRQQQQWWSLLMEAAVNGGRGNGGLHRWQSLSTEARWDGGMMTQWHPQQWCLWPIVVVAMAVFVVSCAAAVDAAATILSLVSMAAAKMQLPLPPSTTASINNSCYCRC